MFRGKNSGARLTSSPKSSPPANSKRDREGCGPPEFRWAALFRGLYQPTFTGVASMREVTSRSMNVAAAHNFTNSRKQTGNRFAYVSSDHHTHSLMCRQVLRLA